MTGGWGGVGVGDKNNIFPFLFGFDIPRVGFSICISAVFFLVILDLLNLKFPRDSPKSYGEFH